MSGPATQSAPGRCLTTCAGATRYPNLTAKDGTVLKIMPHLPAFLRHRRARTPAPSDVPPPVTAPAFQALADKVEKISGVVADAYRAERKPLPPWLDSVDIGAVRITPTSAPGHPESLTAELDPESEIFLAALSNDLWPDDEYLDITP